MPSRQSTARRALRVLRFASYARCSNDDQAAGDFTTTDAQHQINRREVSERGGTLVMEFTDDGRTGTNLKRRGWEDLLAAAKAKKFDCVIVTYMSRLARGEVYHVAEYLLKEAGVTVVLVKEHFSADMAGRTNKRVKILADGMYCDQVSEWTRTKRQEMVIEGHYTGGIVPFGLKSVKIEGTEDVNLTSGKVKRAPRTLVPCPVSGPIVRHAFDLLLRERSLGKVLRYLESACEAAALPHRWTTTRVRNLLSNEVYIGVLRLGDLANEAAFNPPLIPREIWESAQRVLKTIADHAISIQTGREEGYRPRKPIDRCSVEDEPKTISEKPKKVSEKKRDTSGFYLRGRVTCVQCGCRMTPASHHGRTTVNLYYECTNHRKCPNKRVNARMLHMSVLSEIKRLGEHPSRLAIMIREAARALPLPSQAKEELARCKRNLREVDRSTRSQVMALEEPGMNSPVRRGILARLAELEKQREQLLEQKFQLELEIDSESGKFPDVERLSLLLSGMTDAWNGLDEDEREEMMDIIVDSVKVGSDDEGGLKATVALSCAPPSGGFVNSNVARRWEGLEPSPFRLTMDALPLKLPPPRGGRFGNTPWDSFSRSFTKQNRPLPASR